MRRQVIERDRLVVRARYRDIVEVVVHVSLEIEPASLDPLHDCRPREEFRRRSDTKERIGRLNRRIGPDVSDTVSLRERRITVDDCDRRTGDVVGLELGVHHAVEERLEGLRIGKRSVGRSLLGGFGRSRAAGSTLQSERRGTRGCETPKHCTSRVRGGLVIASSGVGCYL